ncbi:MAG: rhodanese-like domain-containing protein [Flavobacteriaceae bacterium]|nr:rhodanese-like domain-containing protein [Flavobacteriaceae bacterium]
MKLLKIYLVLFAVSLLFVNCKEAVDKRKVETQTNKTALNTVAKNVVVKDFKSLIDAQTGILIDVRTPQEYQAGHIPGAINFDWKNQDTFSTIVKEISKDKTVLIYCHSGYRSGLAKAYLQKNGYQKIYNLESGIMGWKAAHFDIEK